MGVQGPCTHHHSPALDEGGCMIMGGGGAVGGLAAAYHPYRTGALSHPAISHALLAPPFGLGLHESTDPLLTSIRYATKEPQLIAPQFYCGFPWCLDFRLTPKQLLLLRNPPPLRPSECCI